jgi:transcriptional regulator with PAS, ATPase and Fis domain
MLKNSFSQLNAIKPDNLPSQGGFDNIIGSSSRMREIFSKIKSIADKDILVLIGGESGTGKELVAQAIHNHSHRKNAPYIKVNCAAIPDTLIESELFGHEKGAFTGAHQRKIGKFELANNGTLFLDEIGDMALTTQSKVLRIIQEREFERIGGLRPIKVNVRIITATHRNLLTEVAQKRFREDLFFRINVVSLLLPPLREKRDDIPVLSRFFIEKFCAKFNKPLKKLDHQVVDAFIQYNWPGNIRELQNVIESAVAVEDDELITLKSLPYPILTEANIHLYGRRRTDQISAGLTLNLTADTADIPNGDNNARAANQPYGHIDFNADCEAKIDSDFNNAEIGRAVELLLSKGLNYEQIERRILEAALKKANGKQLGAARILGVGRGEIQYKIKKYNIAYESKTNGAKL